MEWHEVLDELPLRAMRTFLDVALNGFFMPTREERRTLLGQERLVLSDFLTSVYFFLTPLAINVALEREGGFRHFCWWF